MNAEVWDITVDELRTAAPKVMDLAPGELEVMLTFAEMSKPLLACSIGDDIIALGGVVPVSPLSWTGIVWMQSTHATPRHPITMARVGPRILRLLRGRYYKLVGTCSLGPSSVNWLKSIGARFDETDALAKPFVFGDL